MNAREWHRVDFYAVLGLGIEATEAEVKAAYRALARKHHPDANSGSNDSAERFKSISEAYAILGDVGKRSIYDRVRAGGPLELIPRPKGFDKFRVDVETMRPAMGPPRRGNDLTAEILLSRREARRGRLVRLRCPDHKMPTRTVVVFVRPGIADGEELIIKGKGGFGYNGGGFGDLTLRVKVTADGKDAVGEPVSSDRRYWENPMEATIGLSTVTRMVFKVLTGRGDNQMRGGRHRTR